MCIKCQQLKPLKEAQEQVQAILRPFREAQAILRSFTETYRRMFNCNVGHFDEEED